MTVTVLRPRLIVLALALLGGPFAGGTALATHPRLDEAWRAFHQRRIEDAVKQARRLLPTLEQDAQRRDAHLLIGACAHLEGDGAAATDALITALSYDPGYEPDPLLLPPDLQQLVRRVARDEAAEIQRRRAARLAAERRRRAQRAERARRARRDAERKQRRAERRAREAEPTPIHVAALPFGVGQLANGHRAKGWLLFGGEILLGATSITSLALALNLRGDDGKYAAGDMDRARALNVVYLAAAYAAAGLMIYGLIDGLVYRRSRTERPRATLLLVDPARRVLGLRRSF